MGCDYALSRWRVRAAKGARLESVCGGNSTVGSNPTATAILALAVLKRPVRCTDPGVSH